MQEEKFKGLGMYREGATGTLIHGHFAAQGSTSKVARATDPHVAEAYELRLTSAMLKSHSRRLFPEHWDFMAPTSPSGAQLKSLNLCRQWTSAS